MCAGESEFRGQEYGFCPEFEDLRVGVSDVWTIVERRAGKKWLDRAGDWHILRGVFLAHRCLSHSPKEVFLMSRTKRSSKALEQAERRVAGLKTIDENLDLGTGLTVVAFDTDINGLRDKLNEYNRTLALLDEKLNDLEASEKVVKDKSVRMLNGVAAKYGKDSSEYELAGGVRTSERKKSARKQQPSHTA
jgi:hypothetical protein